MPRILRLGPACYHVLHMIPPTVAHEMGFFFDEGLHDDDGRPSYELVPDSHAPFMFEREALGQTMKERGIDICMDVKPSTVAYMRQHGHDVYIIAGWRNQSPHYVMGSNTVRSIRDLAGKRIGVIDPTDILVTVLSYWLKQEGIDPNQDVEWVRGVDPQRTPAALQDGRVDAGFVDVMDVERLTGDGCNLLLDIRKQYPNGRPDRIIAATARAVEEQSEQVRGFLKAMIRAYWFLRQQPDNLPVIQAVERRLRRQSHDPDEPHRPLQFGSAELAERMPFPYDGLATGLGQYLDEAVSIGLLDDRADLEDISRLDLARAAFHELESRDELRPALDRAKEVAARIGY
ncbi:MAG TPA: ABC transporter substrate-binding protein [Dehalococcoidia bacterium]|nr:ABC transporter substrate-binding protein [Dehalococcoidia bacterium]